MHFGHGAEFLCNMSDTKEKRKNAGKVVKGLRIAGISLLGLLLLVIMFAGPIGKAVIQNHDTDIIGRQIEIKRLKLHLLTGNVRIYGFNMKEADGQNDFVTFDTLDVSVRLLKLLRSELHIPHITLAGPHVQIIQDDSLFNFSDIMERFSNDDPDTSKSNWKIGIYNIRLADGNIRYHDRKLDKEWALKNMHLKVPGVYLDGENSTDAGLSLSFADHGSLRTKVKYNIASNDYEVMLDISRFALSNLTPYLAGALNAEIPQGDFSGKINLSGNLDEPLNLDIQGQCAINKLKINDPEKQEVMSVNNIDIDIDRISLKQQLYAINHVRIDGLSSHYDRLANGSDNFSQLLASPNSSKKDTVSSTAEKAEADTTASAPIRFRLNELSVENCSFTINDKTLEETFRFPITRIKVKAENLNSEEGKNQLKMTAALPDGGFAALHWSGHLDNPKVYQNIAATIKNLNMKQLSPYVVHYLGYPLTEGVFSFTSENSVRNSQLQGDNKVDIYKLTVGDKRQDVKPEVSIPLKAAVYVLNDKDDKILLDIPVAGDLDNPEFSYMKMVWKTLSNLLVKVSVSPLQHMADAVGISSEQLEQMKIDPLQFDFTSEQYDFLSKLTKLAQMDTNIQIQLEQQIDWDKAAHQLSLYNVKRDYYLLQNPEKREYRLQLTDFDRINAINTKDLDFTTFLDDKVGEAYSKKSVAEKAEKLYPLSSMRKELAAMAERRNQFIKYYMVKQSGLNARQLEITTDDTDRTENCYRIGSILRNMDTENITEE